MCSSDLSESTSYGRDITDIYMGHGPNPKAISEIAKRLKEYDIDAYKLFIKYFNLFNECERAIVKIVGRETVLDAHRYNFGYSPDGKLKCLDI